MNRHVLTLDLRDDPDVVSAYREYHAKVWPEVADSLLRAGVRSMDIYLLGRRLVMVLDLQDGLDPAHVFDRHNASGAAIAEWESLMKSFQQPAPGARDGEWWAQMEQVFHLGAAGVQTP
jgi:L-rhamnose mutarotase